MAKAKRATKPVERPVLVTTAHRGVFFGYATETRGETINLARARNCIYWSADVKGFIGLAATGPSSLCRIGPAADLQLRDITAVIEVTPKGLLLKEAAPGAAAIIAVGTCASYGGIPKANPNPTGAVSVSDIIKDKPIVNIPGCPPIPAVMTGVLAHYLTFGSLPELDDKGRPKAFYGETIHDRCYRRPFYDQGKFAKTFDDEGARRGWCLFELGCKGPVTYNACATVKWNGGTSWPVESGHGCLGCSEPDFWDAGGFYKALSVPADPLRFAAAAAVVGAGAGVVASFANRAKKGAARKAHEPITLDDLEK